MATAEIRSLGAFQFVANGTPVATWRAGKCRTLFQYLLLHREEVVSRRRLTDVLWPDRPDPDASNSLKVAVHSLRRILHQDRSFVLDSTGRGYRLRTLDGAAVTVDYEQLQRLGQVARLARTSSETAAAAVAEAAALYRGDYLPEEDADWAFANRAWARSLILGILRDGRAAALRRGDAWTAMGLCLRTLEIEPHDEHSFQTIMWLHASKGERTELVSWFNRCRDRLLIDLDINPAPLTVRLLTEGMRGGAPVLPTELLAIR